MKSYKLSIKLLSDTLIGSGQGFGVLIDSDVVFDQYGIPYLPARRVKGLLRDSAEELNKSALYNESQKNSIDEIFGITGGDKANSYFSDLRLNVVKDFNPWLEYLYNSKLNNIINPEAVKEYYTLTRTQTAIEDNRNNPNFGTAKENSLRTVRVLKKGWEFTGMIQTSVNKNDLLENAAKNLKWLGTKRNRGFGNVECEITKEGNNNE